MFQVDLDHFDQCTTPERRGLGRHEFGQRWRRGGRLPGLGKAVDELRKLLQICEASIGTTPARGVVACGSVA